MGNSRAIYTGLVLYNNDFQTLPYQYPQRYYNALVDHGYFYSKELKNVGHHSRKGVQPSLFLCPTDYEIDQDKLFYFGGYLGSYGAVSRYFGVIDNNLVHWRTSKNIDHISKPTVSPLIGESSTDGKSGSHHINIWDKYSFIHQLNRFKHDSMTFLLMADGRIQAEFATSNFDGVKFSEE